MKKGDIVVVDFPFTDFSSSKLRPALLILENRFDFMICFITSNLKIKEYFDIELQPSYSNGLKVPSLLKTNKIMTVDKSIIQGKIGRLKLSEWVLFTKKIAELLEI